MPRERATRLLLRIVMVGTLAYGACHGLVAAPPDKAKLLFERNRPDMEKNPAKYEGARWYVGALMLIGEVVE